MRSMVFVRLVLLGAFVVGLVPGGLEMFEDVGHLITVGHLEEGDCADACDLSGCTPSSHACPCCGSIHVVLSDERPEVPTFGPRYQRAVPDVDGSPRVGFGRRLPRPPSA